MAVFLLILVERFKCLIFIFLNNRRFILIKLGKRSILALRYIILLNGRPTHSSRLFKLVDQVHVGLYDSVLWVIYENFINWLVGAKCHLIFGSWLDLLLVNDRFICDYIGRCISGQCWHGRHTALYLLITCAYRISSNPRQLTFLRLFLVNQRRWWWLTHLWELIQVHNVTYHGFLGQA